MTNSTGWPTGNSLPTLDWSDTTADSNTPGMSLLGMGVNVVSGSYLDNLSKMQISMFKNTLVNNALMTKYNLYNTTQTIAKSSDDYLQQISASLNISGQYEAFSGSLNTQFGSTISIQSTSYLATYGNLVQLYSLQISNINTGTLYDDLITEQGLHDLWTMDPLQFFQLYGAYFISGMYVGGSLIMSSYATTTVTYNSASIATDTEAGYNNGINSGKINASITYTSSDEKSSYNSQSGLQLRGGSDSTYNPDGSFDTISWINSVRDNPAVVTWQLTAMTELLNQSNPDYGTNYQQRLQALNDALKTYFSTAGNVQPLSIWTFSSPGTLMADSPYDTITVPPDWKVLCGGARVVQPSSGEVNQYLTACYPPDNNTSAWSSSNQCVHNVSNQPLMTYAVAVYDPDDLLVVSQTQPLSTSSSDNPQGSSNPISQGVLTGGGLQSVSDTGSGIMLVTSAPASPDADGSSTAWQAEAAWNEYKNTSHLNITAVSVSWKTKGQNPSIVSCVFPSSPTSQVENISLNVSVQSNYTLVGGGASCTGISLMLQQSYPVLNDEGTWVWQVKAMTGYGPQPGTVTAFAIGLAYLDANDNLQPFGGAAILPK